MKIRLTQKQYKIIKEQEVKIPNDPLLGSIDGHEEKETAFLNNIQYVFDVAGLVPVYGDLIDAINSIIYFIRGKNLEGFLSIIAIIPVVGSIISIPFKVLFKLIPQSAIKKIVNFIHTGNGKQAAQTLIKIGKEKAPNELKKVLEIVRSNMTPIKKGLDKLTEPLVELQKFNHKFIPDYLSNKINKLGNKGIMINNAISKFFKTIDESNDVIIKPLKKATTKEIIKLSKIANEVEKLSKKNPYLTMYHGTHEKNLTLSNLHLGERKPGMGGIEGVFAGATGSGYRSGDKSQAIGLYSSPVVRGDAGPYPSQVEGGTALSYAYGAAKRAGIPPEKAGKLPMYVYEIKLKPDVKLYDKYEGKVYKDDLNKFVGGENNPSIAKLGDFDGAQTGGRKAGPTNETVIWNKDKIESIELVVKGEHNPDSKYWHDKRIWTTKPGIKLKENYFKNKKKIRLTESQHKKMVKEDNRHQVLADKLRQELAGADLITTMQDLTTLYAYTEEEIIGSTILMNLVKDKLLKEIRDNHYISQDLKDRYGNYFDAVGLAAAKEIFNSSTNNYSKFLQLDGIIETIPYAYTKSMNANRDMVREMRDGLIYDTLQYLFDNFSPRDALKRASVMVNRRSVNYAEMYPLVKQFADKHGIILFNKYKGMTFAKKDGMMRSLVNYLKDIEPKTKEGFLDYINSVGRGPGQHTLFWGAAKNAGLVVPVRNGRQITYQLGPNYEAWENDKLVAF